MSELNLRITLLLIATVLGLVAATGHAESTCTAFSVGNPIFDWEQGSNRQTYGYSSCSSQWGAEGMSVVVLIPGITFSCPYYLCNESCSPPVDPCTMCYARCYKSLRVTVQIDGNEEDFVTLFPYGLRFSSSGNSSSTTGSDCDYNAVSVKTTGVECELPRICNQDYIPLMKCFPQPVNLAQIDGDVPLTIIVRCYRASEDGNHYDPEPIAQTSQELLITENPQIDFNPFNIESFGMGGPNTNTCWFRWCEEPVYSYSWDWYELDDEVCCTFSYKINAKYVPPDYYRVKVPAWEKEVSGGVDCADAPVYMACQGWYWDSQTLGDNYIQYNVQGLGMFYFVCDTLEVQGDPNSNHLLSRILYNASGNAITDPGTIALWNYEYAYSSPAKLQSIYNGSSLTTSTKKLTYDWSAVAGTDHMQVDVFYYSRADTQSEWNRGRQKHFEYDSEGRVVKTSQCSSGCGGGSTVYESVEYYPGDEFASEQVKKRYNASGDTVLWNEYAVLQYGAYANEYMAHIVNFSFETADANDGAFEVGCPDGWSEVSVNNDVATVDPSTAQWQSRYDAGEVIPAGEQILNMTGGVIEQELDKFVASNTRYFLDVDLGTYNDAATSRATIKLVAFDFSDPNAADTELIVIDAIENGDPNIGEICLTEGTWDWVSVSWQSSKTDDTHGYMLKIILGGDVIDIDNVRLSSCFAGTDTQPKLLSQRAIDPDATGDPNVTFVEWSHDPDNRMAIEKRWVDNQNARVIKYTYRDKNLSTMASKTEYAMLNENPNDPQGSVYTTYYQRGQDPNLFCTVYPSGTRMDAAFRQNGAVVQSYKADMVTGATVDQQHYTCDTYGNILTHTDARGGVTRHTYEFGLLTIIEEPIVGGSRQVTSYDYDGARRMLAEWRKSSDGSVVKTSYTYNSSTGFLDKIVADDGETGLKETTEYKYNDFGEVIRDKGPDGSITGKSYGLGGELTSEFVLADPLDINETTPDVVSQTLYYYDSDGRIEYIKKVKAAEAFSLCDPNNIPQGTQLVTTKYEYDFLGRKTAVIEDLDGAALKTSYEYNNQGEITKTTLPNGRWTETVRDGRGLVKMQTVGHDNMDPADWQVTLFYYDANGNLKEKVGPDGVSTVYEYDNVDRLTKVKRGVAN